MITDQQTNTIYFSQKLEQVCPNLYHSISTLKEKGLSSTYKCNFLGADNKQ